MLITEPYREQNLRLHADNRHFGVSGHKWAGAVARLMGRLGADDVLDYGCGKRTFADRLRQVWPSPTPPRIAEYDPAIPGLDRRPEPSSVVVCTDVLEHVEPDCLESVLADLARLTRAAAFVVASTRPATKRLPDGRNAHLIVEPAAFWRRCLARHFAIEQWEVREDEAVGLLRPPGLLLRHLVGQALAAAALRAAGRAGRGAWLGRPAVAILGMPAAGVLVLLAEAAAGVPVPLEILLITEAGAGREPLPGPSMGLERVAWAAGLPLPPPLDRPLDLVLVAGEGAARDPARLAALHHRLRPGGAMAGIGPLTPGTDGLAALLRPALDEDGTAAAAEAGGLALAHGEPGDSHRLDWLVKV